MTIGAVLLVYAVAVGWLGPCPRGWLDRAPRLGAAVLLASSWSVLTSLALVGITLAVPATALSGGLSQLLGACVLRLRDAYATPGGGAVAGAGLTLSAVIVCRVAWAAGQALHDRRAEHRRQHLLIALTVPHAAPPAVDRAAVVVDHPRPAAYCLSGRQPTVVVTSGAVDLLTDAQLDAVLAHERAHLAARHHRRLAAAAVASRSLPELPLLREVGERVHRLLEMHADQIAADDHDPATLASALVAVASGGASPAPTARTAGLAADGADTTARIRRLLLPPAPLSRPHRVLARGLATALLTAPLVLALAPGAIAATEPPMTAPAQPAAGAVGAHHPGRHSAQAAW